MIRREAGKGKKHLKKQGGAILDDQAGKKEAEKSSKKAARGDLR